MAGTSLNEVYKAIGTLTAQVEGLRRDIKDNEDRNAANVRKADESRANVHRRLDEVVMRTTHLESDVLTVKTKVQDIESVTDEVKAWKQRGIGALFVVGIASAALSGMIVHFWDALTRFFKAL